MKVNRVWGYSRRWARSAVVTQRLTAPGVWWMISSVRVVQKPPLLITVSRASWLIGMRNRSNTTLSFLLCVRIYCSLHSWCRTQDTAPRSLPKQEENATNAACSLLVSAFRTMHVANPREETSESNLWWGIETAGAKNTLPALVIILYSTVLWHCDRYNYVRMNISTTATVLWWY